MESVSFTFSSVKNTSKFIPGGRFLSGEHSLENDSELKRGSSSPSWEGFFLLPFRSLPDERERERNYSLTRERSPISKGDYNS